MKKRRKKKKMRRSLIPALVAMTLILLILAASAGMFLYQRYSYSDEEADLNAYFGLSASDELCTRMGSPRRRGFCRKADAIWIWIQFTRI